jgi:hypothetical protein
MFTFLNGSSSRTGKRRERKTDDNVRIAAGFRAHFLNDFNRFQFLHGTRIRHYKGLNLYMMVRWSRSYWPAPCGPQSHWEASRRERPPLACLAIGSSLLGRTHPPRWVSLKPLRNRRFWLLKSLLSSALFLTGPKSGDFVPGCHQGEACPLRASRMRCGVWRMPGELSAPAACPQSLTPGQRDRSFLDSEKVRGATISSKS